jgi:predicted DNA-binding transcriptional regulator YafY
MKLSKPLRYLQLASAIKNSPAQTPEQLWQDLGIKKAQFNRDKKDLQDLRLRAKNSILRV